MFRLLLLSSFLTIATTLSAQWQIGHTSITFMDPARNNRPVLTDIYYPAEAAGDNVPLAAGQYPVIPFGHGFVMAWSAYQNFWETLVPQGFILCFPRTEGSFSPSHTDFARDLAFLCSALEAEKVQPASLFFGHIQSRYGILGHSMGGGCAVLSYPYNPALIKCVATFAPANTNPSAIAIAPGVSIPSLTFAGSYDCIAPPAQQALLIFTALDTAACKIYVDIDGGSHCQFANANTNCNLGEALSGCSNPPVSAAVQQALVSSLLLPWLNTYLKEAPGFLAPLLDSLAAENGFSALHTCENTTGVAATPSGGIDLKILSNPVWNDVLEVALNGADRSTPVACCISDVAGRLWMQVRLPPGLAGDIRQISTAGLSPGLYYLLMASQDGKRAVQKFVKM